MCSTRARGFSLIEVLVTLGIVSIVMIGLYKFLDTSNRVAKQQTQVADAQAASRAGMYEVARILRQARVGQLYFANSVLPDNDTDGSRKLNDGTNDHIARQGTDLLEVRGVLFDQLYFFDSSDVSVVTPPLDVLSVTIKPTSSFGVPNFQGTPAIASRKDGPPFWFVIASSEAGLVPVGTKKYLNTVYYVGLVDPTTNFGMDGTTGNFKFQMKCTSGGLALQGAAPFYPTGTAPATLQRAFSGGVLDDVIFYVDRGAQDPGPSPATYSHPFLAEALLNTPAGGGAALTYSIQPLVDEVEDFQVAYGIDGINSLPRDRGVDPKVETTDVNTDEWVFNVTGETLDTSAGVTNQFIDQTIDGSGDSFAISALRAVRLGLVAKSLEPDNATSSQESFVAAKGYKLFDSAATPVSGAGADRYRRRVQTMAVALRNYL